MRIYKNIYTYVYTWHTYLNDVLNETHFFYLNEAGAVGRDRLPFMHGSKEFIFLVGSRKIHFFKQ